MAPGHAPLPPKPYSSRGNVPTRLRLGHARHEQPLSVKDIAAELPAEQWHSIEWREGTNLTLRARFALVRVLAAHREHQRTRQRDPEWLLIEWPKGHKEPMKYWLSTLSEEVPLGRLVHEAKMRWRIERDYQEPKQELGLGHYEGRGRRWFHHPRQPEHRRLRLADGAATAPPRESRQKTLHEAKNLPYPRITSFEAGPRTQRHVPSSITSLRLRIAAALLKTLPRCPCCMRVNARLRF